MQYHIYIDLIDNILFCIDKTVEISNKPAQFYYSIS